MPSVLHITNIPTPYRLPLFREITRRAAERGIDFSVYFLGNGRRDRHWKIPLDEFHGINHTMPPGAGEASISGAIRAIREGRPSVVVLAWAMDLTALRLLLYCRLRSIPCVVVSGETARSAAGNPHRMLRRLFRQPFFRLADGFLTYGTQSSRYLLGSGVPASRVMTGINVVDSGFFARRVDELRRDGREGSAEWGHLSPEGDRFVCHLLFVGYLLPEKGGRELIEGFARLGRSDIALHIVGSGEERENLEELARVRGVSVTTFFHGYRQTSELPLYYAIADILIFPSLEEVYGLVMVEGAAAALPIIASCNAGGTIDVVEDGVNGLVVDPADSAAMAGAIARLADDRELRVRMGEASRRRAETILTIGRSAELYLERITMSLG